MLNKFTGKRVAIILVSLALSLNLNAQPRDVAFTIHLRGVYESKISLLGLTPAGTFKPVLEVQGVKNVATASLVVPKDKLPGEFVMRFDYKENITSTPYPSEKYMFINDQDLELWVSPMYCNNPDSTRFQEGERENAAYGVFSRENGQKREKLGLLQQFLMSYDDTKSKFYRKGIKEYEKRRSAYNEWLDNKVKSDDSLFVSSLYRFNYVPQIPWEGSEEDRMFSLIDHYFDGIDFNDPLIIKTSQIIEWMNSYVNLHGQMATSVALRDSLIPAAAHTAIEKAKLGDPVVYGWMVDYFYRGFEANNIPAGMKVLEPYLDDPNCLTTKRMEINRRLEGMETLLPGTKAPDIVMTDSDGYLFELYGYEPGTKYILLYFWSADCSHCAEITDALYPWQQSPENQPKISVVAISLDETETEVNSWETKIKELSGWKHLRAAEGVNSQVAADYFVLATPVMVLLDASTMEIVALPENTGDLKTIVK